HGEAGHGGDEKADARQGLARARRCRHPCTRSASRHHTGVTLPGRSGSLPRSVWLSAGLWQSLSRQAARLNSAQKPAYLAYAAWRWAPVTASTARPPCCLNSENRAYSSVAVNL